MPEARAIYAVDRGYLNFAPLHNLHQASAFFVTRAKSNINARRIYSAATELTTGLICDRTVALNGYYGRWDYPTHFPRIRFKDPESDKTLGYLTNNLALVAAMICALYKA